MLPPITHPDPNQALVAGTGLTHLGSASARSDMHEGAKMEKLTPSMKLFQDGIKGGKPGVGKVGVQPEWFYKGNGHSVLVPVELCQVLHLDWTLGRSQRL